jgi:hypothetical protein
MNLAKSQKWRERQRAYEANQLHDWHAAREAQAAPTSPPPEPPPTAPDFGIRTLDGASWSEDSRYMRWTLPVSSGSNRPTPRNF